MNPNGYLPTLKGKRTQAVEKEYLVAFRSACTVDDVVAITSKLVEIAKCGDIAAAKIVLDRALPTKGLESLMESGQVGAVQVLMVSQNEMNQRRERLRQAVVR